MRKSLLVLSLSLMIALPSFSAGIFDFSSKEDTSDVQQVELKPASYAPAARITSENVEVQAAAPIKIAEASQDVNQNIQNVKYAQAIQNLEAAQAGLREELINYNMQFNEIKARYYAAREEYKAARRQIKDTEKQIKNIEKTKKSINKNISGNS